MGVVEPCLWGISCSFASGFLIQPNLLVLELLDVGFRVGAISAEDDTAYNMDPKMIVVGTMQKPIG